MYKRQIVQDDSLYTLRSQILEGNNVSLRCSLRLLISFIEYDKRKYLINSETYMKIQSLIIELMPFLVAKLRSDTMSNFTLLWNNQQSIKFRPFGLANQRILEFIECAFKFEKCCIQDTLDKCNVFQLLLSIVNEYSNNTNVHLLIFGIFNYALNNSFLCERVIIQNDIAQLLLQLHLDAIGVFPSGRKYTKPYDIHILELSICLESVRKCVMSLNEYLGSK